MKRFPSNLTRSAFENRKDKNLFSALSIQCSYLKPESSIKFFTSNFFYNPQLWVGDFLDNEEKAKARWLAFEGFQTNAPAMFRAEIERNTRDPKSFFSIEDSKTLMPAAINKVVAEQLCPSVLVIYDLLNPGWFDLLCENSASHHNFVMKKICDRLQKHKQLHSYKDSTLNQCGNFLSNIMSGN